MKPFSLEIQFPASRSKIYPEVLKHARLFSDFNERPNALKITDIEELFGRWGDFSFVIFNTTKWAGTNVYFDGKPLLPYRNDFFYRLLDIKHCYGQYKESVDKCSFCSGSDWGCYRLTHIGRYFTLSTYHIKNPFYKYGSFADKNTWLIDKRRISQILFEEAKTAMVDTCPAFDPERINVAVLKLTDQIAIDQYWEVDHRLDVTVAGVVAIPTGISFVPNPQPPEPLAPEEDFIDPEEDIDGYLDKLLRDREKNREDDYSDLL